MSERLADLERRRTPWVLRPHPVPGRASSFYLCYLPGPSGRPMISPFADRYDAAAFIIGLAGRKLQRAKRKRNAAGSGNISRTYSGTGTGTAERHDDPCTGAVRCGCDENKKPNTAKKF